VPGGDVVLGDGAPEDFRRIGRFGPALDAGEEALDTRAVAPDVVALATYGPLWKVFRHPLAGGVLDKDGHQVFRAREYENVRVDGVEVLWESLVGLARDRRQRKAPAEAEWTIAGTGVISQG